MNYLHSCIMLNIILSSEFYGRCLMGWLLNVACNTFVCLNDFTLSTNK